MMSRVRRKTGLTLIELLISLMLFTTVVVTATAVLDSFKSFYAEFMSKQETMGEVSLAALEELTSKLKVANRVSLSTGGGVNYINPYVDENRTQEYADDIRYRFYKDSEGNLIYERFSSTGLLAEQRILTKNITSFTFEYQPAVNPAYNRVKITLGVKLPDGNVQYFETNIVMMCRSAHEQYLVQGSY
jgi:hypothetical protein